MRQKGLDLEFGSGPQLTRRRPLSVSELTDRIQGVLEKEFVDVWIEGEIANLKMAPSGHWYFSLRDERAQIRAVVWKADARLIRFHPEDGMKVVARGAVRLYSPRGEYQLAVQVLEPLGKGSLQQAFEERKERLAREGLFDSARKRPLPMLPRRIGVVTSPAGAVIRDILRVLAGRYSNLEVLLYPARVQGEGAASEIAQGVRALNHIGGLDVIIVARGGGSLEDLWAFNDEEVARALAASRIPTISAVGHETDFTIADFVADLRAPTPSAAAERVVQAKAELAARIGALERRRDTATRLRLARARARAEAAILHRAFEGERGRLRTHAQRVDELARRADMALARQAERSRHRFGRGLERLDAFRWDRQIALRRGRIDRQDERLVRICRAAQEGRRAAVTTLAGKLAALSPLAVLGRGYSLVWNREGRALVRDAAEVDVGEMVRIRLARGRLEARVSGRDTEAEETA